METTIKNKLKNLKTESNNAQLYANDAYFVKKREASLKLLQKAGVPALFAATKK